jgi:hypothetical protein
VPNYVLPATTLTGTVKSTLTGGSSEYEPIQECLLLLQCPQRNLKQHTRKTKSRLQEPCNRTSASINALNASDAVILVKKAYEYFAKKKLDAWKMILEAVIDLETSNRIPPEQQEDRDQYVSFILSDIQNACKSFTGNKNQMKFHPLMANFAMNLYMGMKYEDIVDAQSLYIPHCSNNPEALIKSFHT